jgi:hypothetical protein
MFKELSGGIAKKIYGESGPAAGVHQTFAQTHAFVLKLIELLPSPVPIAVVSSYFFLTEKPLDPFNISSAVF